MRDMIALKYGDERPVSTALIMEVRRQQGGRGEEREGEGKGGGQRGSDMGQGGALTSRDERPISTALIMEVGLQGGEGGRGKEGGGQRDRAWRWGRGGGKRTF